MTTVECPEPTDVVVLGGGVIGLACARALLAAGRSVRVIEGQVHGTSDPRAASHGNCGLITPSHAPPLNQPSVLPKVLGWMLRPHGAVHIKPRHTLALIRFGWGFARAARSGPVRRSLAARAGLLNRSRVLYDQLVAEQGFDCEWHADGLYVAFATRRAFEAELRGHASLRAHGVDVHELASGELIEREPLLRADLAGGVFYPGDAHLRPDRLVSELGRMVRAAGGILDEGVEATGFERSGERITHVRSASSRLPVQDVVLAAGAWSGELAESVGYSFPMQPAKGFSITVPRPDRAPRVPLILEEAALGVTPWKSGLRLGGRMEFGGLDGVAPRTRYAAMRSAARRYLEPPLFDEGFDEGPGGGAEEWFGYRPMTPDELPVIGRVPRTSNLYLATGHGRLGVSMAPATGELLTQLMLGVTPHIDPEPFSPARFA